MEVDRRLKPKGGRMEVDWRLNPKGGHWKLSRG